MMFKFLKISCNQAAEICNKSQYGEASFTEKIKLKLHFLECKICSIYTKQNTFLSVIFKQHAKSCKATQHKMKDTDKESIKEEIAKKTA